MLEHIPSEENPFNLFIPETSFQSAGSVLKLCHFEIDAASWVLEKIWREKILSTLSDHRKANFSAFYDLVSPDSVNPETKNLTDATSILYFTFKRSFLFISVINLLQVSRP